MPEPASRSAIVAIAVPLIVAAIAVPGVIFALTHGRTRTTSLLVDIGVELAVIVCVGLYLRLRLRA
jgi:hypothetical protein